MHSKHIQRASRWQLVLAVLACLAFSKWSPAQTVNPDAPKKPKFDITKPLGDTYAAASSVAIEQSRLVIYRPRTSDEKSGVISVYISVIFVAGVRLHEFESLIPTPVTSFRGFRARSFAQAWWFSSRLKGCLRPLFRRNQQTKNDDFTHCSYQVSERTWEVWCSCCASTSLQVLSQINDIKTKRYSVFLGGSPSRLRTIGSSPK